MGINMDILLDTCSLIWLFEDSQRLPSKIKSMVDDKDNEVYVSIASLWEIEIKHNKKPNAVPFSSNEAFTALSQTKIKMIDIKPTHIFEVSNLGSQNIHNDPFDHLLLSTAKSEKLTLLTHDSTLKRYEGIDILCY